MEASDSYRREPRKPSMYGDWDEEAHMASGEDTDTDGNMNGWVGAPYVQPPPMPRYLEPGAPQQQPSTPTRRHSKKHDWGNQLCSRSDCDKLLRETPQVRWGPEGPMCNACGCKRSRDKAKANGGHVPHFPKNYRPPQFDPYWGYAAYDPYAAYAHHYPHLAPMPHPHHLQGPLGILPPPPGIPLAHFAPYPMAAAQVALAAAANNSVRVVRRSAARRTTAADTPADTPASSSAGGVGIAGAPGSPAVGSPPMRHTDQSFSAPASPLVTRDGDLEAAAAAAMSATKQHPQQRRAVGGGMGGSPGGEARRARSSSPAASDSSLWFALLEVVQEESEGPSPRRPGKRAASDMEVEESDQEFTSPRSRPPQRAKLSRFAHEVGSHAGLAMCDSEMLEVPALQYTATGRPARHAHKQLGDDFVAP